MVGDEGVAVTRSLFVVVWRAQVVNEWESGPRLVDMCGRSLGVWV